VNELRYQQRAGLTQIFIWEETGGRNDVLLWENLQQRNVLRYKILVQDKLIKGSKVRILGMNKCCTSVWCG
jgi:hypothetical protein